MRLLALLLLTASAVAQPAIITGTIVDSETGQPLPGVSVYLSGSTLGDASDADGAFSFETALLGDLVLAASMVGYEAIERPVRLRSGQRFRVALRLRSQTTTMENVVVEGDSRERREYLDRFRHLFLGHTPNARATQIANPNALSFSEQDGRLTARTRSPLRLTNQRLGYDITWDALILQGSGRTRVWSGATRFTPLHGTERDEAAWSLEREQAYKGSWRHFLDALRDSAVAEAGFVVFPVDNAGDFSTRAVPIGTDSLARALSPALGRVWHVIYLRERADREGRVVAQRNIREAGSGNAEAQWSWIRIGEKGIQFEPDGRLANPLDHVLSGYWNYERAADLLPADYQLPRN